MDLKVREGPSRAIPQFLVIFVWTVVASVIAWVAFILASGLGWFFPLT